MTKQLSHNSTTARTDREPLAIRMRNDVVPPERAGDTKIKVSHEARSEAPRLGPLRAADHAAVLGVAQIELGDLLVNAGCNDENEQRGNSLALGQGEPRSALPKPLGSNLSWIVLSLMRMARSRSMYLTHNENQRCQPHSRPRLRSRALTT